MDDDDLAEGQSVYLPGVTSWGRDLFTWGHGAFVESLFRNSLVNLHPVIVGEGGVVRTAGLSASMRLVSAQVFMKGIVKLSYERA